uniref:Uncharacterized protein n=1 Tax=Oryza nivara TaxID=4536 RepID=A0A0E0IKY1_ORYNI
MVATGDVGQSGGRRSIAAEAASRPERWRWRVGLSGVQRRQHLEKTQRAVRWSIASLGRGAVVVAWRSNGRLAHGGITTCSSSLGFVSVEPVIFVGHRHRSISCASFPAAGCALSRPPQRRRRRHERRDAVAAATFEKGGGGGTCDLEVGPSERPRSGGTSELEVEDPGGGEVSDLDGIAPTVDDPRLPVDARAVPTSLPPPEAYLWPPSSSARLPPWFPAATATGHRRDAALLSYFAPLTGYRQRRLRERRNRGRERRGGER